VCIMYIMCMCVTDTLFAAFEDGAILKVDTCTNPCTVLAEWQCDNLQSQPLYLFTDHLPSLVPLSHVQETSTKLI